ncbi:hypothetical protein ARSEF1564_009802 [Beauveria bassiana]
MSRNPVGLAFTSLLLAVARAPKGSLYGADTINGYKYAEVPSGEHYILNSTKTLQDALPDGSKDPKGPYGNWRGAEDTCSLTWEFHYWTICSKQPSDATLIHPVWRWKEVGQNVLYDPARSKAAD